MHSTEVQAKPLFSWKALGWALLYFWFFSTLLQAIIYISGYSGTNGIRDSLLFSSLWLIPVFLFPKRIKIIAAVIGVVLWAALWRRCATTSSTVRSSRRAFCL